MVDQYLIPKDQNEYRWLNENMPEVSKLYESQRQIQIESQKRLFSGKKANEKMLQSAGHLKSGASQQSKRTSNRRNSSVAYDLMGQEILKQEEEKKENEKKR